MLLAFLIACHAPLALADNGPTKSVDDVFPETDGLTVLDDSNVQFYRVAVVQDHTALACALFTAYAERCEKADDSEYAAASLKKAAAKDPRVKAALSGWRAALTKREFVVRPNRQDAVYYSNGKFKLSVGTAEPGDRWDQIRMSVVLGSGTDGISVGAWKRVAWTRGRLTGDGDGIVTLTGMPEPLKARIETDFNSSVYLRWRWKGLAKPLTLRSKPIYGIVMTNTYVAPDLLTLEFIDSSGASLWTFQ
jgi:hypothetical protein